MRYSNICLHTVVNKMHTCAQTVNIMLRVILSLCGVVSHSRQVTTGVEGLGFVCSHACSTCLSTSTIFCLPFCLFTTVCLPSCLFTTICLFTSSCLFTLLVCLPSVYLPPHLLTSSCLFIFLFIYTHLFVYLICLFTSAYCCLL